MDKEILRQQGEGLKASIETLRESEKVMIKAQTLQEQAEKARGDADKARKDLEKLKERQKEIQAQKQSMLGDVCKGLSAAVTVLLPSGVAVFRIDDGKVSIGWQREEGGPVTPYTSLSGGQRVFFEAALSNAMLIDSKHSILVLEAAEMDLVTLRKTMDTLAKTCTAQVLLNTWADPGDDIPEGWNVIRLAEKAKVEEVEHVDA